MSERMRLTSGENRVSSVRSENPTQRSNMKELRKDKGAMLRDPAWLMLVRYGR